MNTIISKLEQDDRILAELDNQLRSVSTRTSFIDDYTNKIRSKSTAASAALTSTTITTNQCTITSNSNRPHTSLASISKSSAITADYLAKKSLHSLPSLNSDDINEWKFQDYQSVLNDDHFRNESGL